MIEYMEHQRDQRTLSKEIYKDSFLRNTLRKIETRSAPLLLSGGIVCPFGVYVLHTLSKASEAE